MTTVTTPLHLSRLFLNDRHRHASRDLGSPYALHQTLRWAFPGAGHPDTPLPDGERLLWRQDTTRDPHTDQPTPTLLVQSVTPPDWGALNARDEGYLQGWDVRTLDLTPALMPGRVLHFRLHANVTVRRRDEQGHSARHGLHRPEEQLEWLDRQGGRAGFNLLGADIIRAGRIRTRKGRQLITLHTVTFDGALQVMNPEALGQSIREGLGHAKSLGCGLLSLAP
ncbi:type I-E CRISPR-associated protein Cas6/Cse3/CasE [Deinococcus apachensis]|uniref:type I-E CRISPR-associated protein Cas6/Cse3/CasE n=1 Tax=Deinococcus apachensis TaxID=309886 RepID=UPI000365613D|nr:type I-E CRISPR-associated protein Cas6/Cse3/CasE [Deinococcus apachensis]